MKKDNEPLVSAVIVTYNNKQWLLKCIPSLLEQTYKNIEIVVVDNASLDQAGDFVKKHFSDNPLTKLRARKIRVVKLTENRGFGAGVNAGIREAGGKYVLVANEDMVFDKNYVEKIVEVFETNSDMAAAQGLNYQIREEEGDNWEKTIKSKKENLQSRGLYFNYSGILTGKAKVNKNNAIVDIFSATIPMIIDKEFVGAIEGFDEDFFLYYEEVDLCWRVWLNGRRVVCISQAKAYHVGGMTTKKLSEEKLLEYGARNRILSFIKNLQGLQLFVGLLMQALITTTAWLFYLLKGRFGYCYVILKAWLWNIYHLKRTFAKRLKIQRSRVLSDKQIFKKVGGIIPFNKLVSLSGFRRK